MSRNKLVIILLVFVVAFGCVVALMRKQAAQTWRLPDGSELSLAKVTYGKKHEMRGDNRWQDYLYPILPGSWRLKLHCAVVTVTNDTDTVVAWFWRKNEPQPVILPSGLPSNIAVSYHLVAVDEHGKESEFPFGETGGRSGLYISTPGLELDYWDFATRSKVIKIRIYTTEQENETKGQLVAEIKIPNPNAK